MVKDKYYFKEPSEEKKYEYNGHFYSYEPKSEKEESNGEPLMTAVHMKRNRTTFFYPSLEGDYSEDANDLKRADDDKFIEAANKEFQKLIPKYNSLSQEKKYSQKSNNSLSPASIINQNTLDDIRMKPYLHREVDADDFGKVSFLRKNMRDYYMDNLDETHEGKIVQRIFEILKRKHSSAYKKFVHSVDRINKVQESILQNFVNRYAKKNRKSAINLEVLTLNSKTIKEITDYYKMDSVAVEFINSLKKRNEKNLKDLVEEAYSEVSNTYGIWN